jgi:transcription initiation factor IIF auxiliary subunit
LLGKIKKVEYHLHPTFPVKDIVSIDRKANFKIEGSGWGEFSVGVDIFTDKDAKISHSHYLTLRHNNETAFSVELSKFSPFQS